MSTIVDMPTRQWSVGPTIPTTTAKDIPYPSCGRAKRIKLELHSVRRIWHFSNCMRREVSNVSFLLSDRTVIGNVCETYYCIQCCDISKTSALDNSGVCNVYIYVNFNRFKKFNKFCAMRVN